MGSVKERISGILQEMSRATYEREEALSLSLLAALSGESIFLLGLPGVGKSMIARRLKDAFHDARVFEYLMSRFSTPDEIFGPVSISKLKDEDRYERVTSGYLPEADVVFLDEIWKAGPAIQNALLTVLNERIYLNGNREMSLPVKGIIAASNELPARDEGLEALWDRFLIRYIVSPLTSKDSFFNLISGEAEETAREFSPLSDDEYEKIRNDSALITLPEIIKETIYKIRERMSAAMNELDVVTGERSETAGLYYVSDRRWKKSVNVMRTSAYLNNRKSVDFSDVLLLYHILWNDDSIITEVRKIVVETVMTVLFKECLEPYKSNRRHAKSVKKDSGHLYSPDGINYIIEVEDAPMKLAIKDYERIMKSPADTFFGSETADGRLILRSRGQYVLRWVKQGHININNFTYPLRTLSDDPLGRGFISEAAGSVSDLTNGLYSMIENNIFLKDSDIQKQIRDVVSLYRNRLE